MSRIEIENLSVTYLDRKRNEHPVLKNIFGCFESGTVNIITGASGVGKTTLLKAIAGHFDYDGTVRFDGKDVLTMSITEKGSIAYICQQTFLFQNKIVYDILSFPLKQQRKKPEEIDKEVKNMSEFLGISDLLTRKPKELSPGQKQKVALGKSLIKNPKICLFDEPFSNLDPESKTLLISHLRKVAHETETVIIIVSHSNEDAECLGASVYSLTEGGLAKTGDYKNNLLLEHNLETRMTRECVSLPINRKQLFKDLLKNRYQTLFLVGLSLLIFMLPFIVVSTLNDLTLASFFANSENYLNGSFTEAGQSLYKSTVLNFTFFYDACFIVLAIGLAGAVRVLRSLCWGEGVQYFHSFLKGIKQNSLRYICLMLFFIIVFTAARFILLSANILWAFVLVSSIGVFVIIPIIFVCFGYSDIYSNPLHKSLSNSAILTIKNYPTVLLFSIIYSIPLLIEIIPYGLSIVKTVLLCVFVIFILPLILLLGGLALNSIFDKEINAEKHKDIYRRGLY